MRRASIAAGARRSAGSSTPRSPPPTPRQRATPSSRHFDGARDVAAFVDAQRIQRAAPPLAGVGRERQDLFDVAGHPTTAASRAARRRGGGRLPAVARLRGAGAPALVGHTNMMSSPTRASASITSRRPANRPRPRSTPRRASPAVRPPGSAVSVAAAQPGPFSSRTPGFAASRRAAGAWSGSRGTARSCRPQAASRCRRRWTRWARSRARCATRAVLAAPTSRSPAAALCASGRADRVFLDGLEPPSPPRLTARSPGFARAGAAIDRIALPGWHRCRALRAAGGFAGMGPGAWHRACSPARGGLTRAS